MLPLRNLLYPTIIIQLCFIPHVYLNNCDSKQTCSECIQELGCVWCIKPISKDASHCKLDNKNNFRWCRPEDLKKPNSTFSIVQNRNFSNKTEFTVQIKPQKVKLSLRKGEEFSLPFQYARAANYPVDLYYIMDLSKSMKDHKNKLAKLGEQLYRTMISLTSNVRLGFGSFVDKVDLPFTSTVESKLKAPCEGCVRPYSFKNHMSLSENYTQFIREVSMANISGNLDAPEGGLDAMMQAIVCKDEIAWRPHARHLLIFSTDDEFHIAGDGKLAGVVEPNSAQCHMENNIYTYDLLEDYPSVSQINYVAKENNINIIFAIVQKNNVVDSYKGLSRQIENSVVGVFGGKSDVVKLVVDNYKRIVDTVKISANSSNDVEVKIEPSCPDHVESGCRNISADETVNFSATIKPLQCADGSRKEIISIKPEAVEESIIIELEVLCDCDCETGGNGFEVNSSECKNSGTLRCGVCDCNDGFFGQNCECNRNHSTTYNVSACKATEDSKVCSGLGVCKCGQCICQARDKPDEKIFGKYCDCDNYSCRRVGGKLCSGRGKCTCGGKCDCQAGWTGDGCDCSESMNHCIKPDNKNFVCNNHGKCICNKCHCFKEEVKYSGKYCDECPTCTGQRCEELRNCVECQAYKDGSYNETECQTNCSFAVNTVEKIDNDEDENTKRCTLVDAKSCTFVFQYMYVNGTDLKVTAEKTKFCPAPPNLLVWVFGVIGSILLAGLILLLIWKVFTSIHDRREYAKFENERQKLRWHNNENPLYKQATSTFSNPVYRRSRSWFRQDSS